MSDPELARRLARNLIAAQTLWTQSDPILAERYGLAHATVAGVECFSARRFPSAHGFGDLAIGYGTLGSASARTLDAILAHYASLGLPPRVALLGRLSPRAAVAALRSQGLHEVEPEHHLFVRTARGVPRGSRERGVRVERVPVADAAPLAMLANAGFGGRGPAAEYFTRARIGMLRDHPRAAIAFRATRGGEPAGSGIVVLAAGAGSMWSGSVIPAHRGHGVQRALLVERVRLGLARGARAFCSLAEAGGPSARNLEGCGFRDVGPLRVFTR